MATATRRRSKPGRWATGSRVDPEADAREDRNRVQTLADRMIEESRLLFLDSAAMSQAQRAGCARDLAVVRDSIVRLVDQMYRLRRPDLLEAARARHTAWLHAIRDGARQ